MKPLELNEHEPFDDGENLLPDEQNAWFEGRNAEAMQEINKDVQWQKRELKRIGGNIDE